MKPIFNNPPEFLKHICKYANISIMFSGSKFHLFSGSSNQNTDYHDFNEIDAIHFYKGICGNVENYNCPALHRIHRQFPMSNNKIKINNQWNLIL